MSASDCIPSPFFNQSTELLSSSPRARFPNHLDSSYEQMHEIERQFCKDFSCCGLNLGNLHELLEHYEEYHSMDTDAAVDGATSDDDVADSGLLHRHQNVRLKDHVQNSSVTAHAITNPSMTAATTRTVMADAAANASASIISATASPTIYHQTMMMMLNMNYSEADKDHQGVHPSLSNRAANIPSPSSPFGKQHLTTADLNMLENANKYASKTKVETLDSLKDGHNGLHTPTSLGSPITEPLDRESNTMLLGSNMLRPSHNHKVKEETDQGSEKSTKRQSLSSSSPSTAVTIASTYANKKDACKNKRGSPSAVSATSSSGGNDVTDTEDRPYRCQIANCDKAYKNANGLKYHRLHGHCPPSDENDEWDASRPYVCSLGDGYCRKRYKNLNGLKYHMEHTHKTKMNLTSEMFLKQNEAMMKTKNTSNANETVEAVTSEAPSETRASLTITKASSTATRPSTAATRVTRSTSISKNKSAAQHHLDKDRKSKTRSIGNLKVTLGCKRNLSATSLLAS